jgi:hypothetical protein
MNDARCWEPPGGPTRAACGLLGVVGGESWRDGALTGFEPDGALADGPVTTALVDLCHSYVARRGHIVPVDVAERHDGVAGPAWLLAVALVRVKEADLIADTLELALAAGMTRSTLGDCVAYVRMASALFAGQPVETAIEAATGWSGPSAADSPHLCGESAADAVAAGVWALHCPGGMADVVPRLAAVAPPGVGAAAAGLVGLRDGDVAVPSRWYRRLRSSAVCLALAPGLVRARCHGYLERCCGEGESAPPGPVAAAQVSCSRSPAAATVEMASGAPVLPQRPGSERRRSPRSGFLARSLVGSAAR